MREREELRKMLKEILVYVETNKDKDSGFEAVFGIIATLYHATKDDGELLQLTKAILEHVEKRTGKGPSFLPPTQN